MSQADHHQHSLLSLSIAASNAAPIPIPISSFSPPVVTSPTTSKHHRRLSSTGKARRRLSDARDAANRPSPASLLQSPSTQLSLASLSLSSSPPSAAHPSHVSTSLGAASTTLTSEGAQLAQSDSTGTLSHAPKPDSADPSINGNTLSRATPIPIVNGKNRKRGMDHKCESCSKIYRHPSCLIKHRWEHTPHWREASKYVLSKHQQVQLLEAAAILSHLSPNVSSLPEDRSLWPFFLSGGSLPPPENVLITPSSHSPMAYHNSANHNLSFSNTTGLSSTSPKGNGTAIGGVRPTSSSVPTQSGNFFSYSNGPTIHQYAVSPPTTAGATQVRPAPLGVGNDNGVANAGTPTPAVAAKHTASVPAPALIEEEEDTKKQGHPSSPKHYRSRSRSGSGSGSLPFSGSASESGSIISDGEGESIRMHRPFGRGDDGGDGFKWQQRAYGMIRQPVREGSYFESDEETGEEQTSSWRDRDRRKQTQEEWDGMDMDMDMD
ncbi:hypothetical protein AMATHDRAFT_46941 [Amanita thiersii Skay4041]|uniref:C2H2-type domain-containing protein n=1 Tax=Amanita thiersii Skay4041 TaxID=703135 RepID=A0A2A9NV65_9AGAR|nr:hypothetical protein AMATHDRAFT_46941 [Amanita thiersii Skay4041]